MNGNVYLYNENTYNAFQEFVLEKSPCFKILFEGGGWGSISWGPGPVFCPSLNDGGIHFNFSIPSRRYANNPSVVADS